MKKPLVTVLMAVYNGEAYLEEAVESILAQTYQTIEFLIIDDASTDRSPEILQAYQDQRIKLLRNEANLGLTESLNVGLAQAQGKYIARMDADDVSYPQRLAQQVAFLEIHPEIGLCGTWAMDLNKGTQIPRIFPCDDQAIRFTLLKYNPFVHTSVMFRTQLIREHYLTYDTHFVYAQDYDLWTRMANYTKIANLPEFLVQYRIHNKQVTVGRFEQQEVYIQQVISRQLEKLAISVTPEKIELHRAVLASLGERLKQYRITEGHAWLVYLLRQNRKYVVYEPTYFFLRLEECWLELLYAVPVLNRETLRLVVASPFRIVSLSRWKFSLRLLSKLMYYKIFK